MCDAVDGLNGFTANVTVFCDLESFDFSSRRKRGGKADVETESDWNGDRRQVPAAIPARNPLAPCGKTTYYLYCHYHASTRLAFANVVTEYYRTPHLDIQIIYTVRRSWNWLPSRQR